MKPVPEWEHVIVVGFDGSSHSEEALRWTVDEAKMRGSTVHIVHAWQPPLGTWSTSLKPIPDPADTTETDGEEYMRLFEDAVASVIGERPEVDVHTSVRVGNPAAVLIEAAKREHAELLVVGSRGNGGFKRLLLGSVSEQCVTHANCPVVVTHEGKRSRVAKAEDRVVEPA